MDILEKRNAELHATAIEEKKEGVYAEENVGLRADWYTDAQFAQQHLTGVNPTGLKRASTFWIAAFRAAAHAQENEDAEHLLSSCAHDTLYMVDNSDFRSILGKSPDAIIVSADSTMTSKAPRFGCASVTLFTLSPHGTLHPVAVVLDYRGSIDAATSVTIFNRRPTSDAQCVDEKSDWPWRYAKMCSHTADWTRHELAVHLVHTHFIEEGLIVAAQRSFPDTHVILQILQPHWKKTLSLNALARQLLVPVYINDITPVQLADIQAFCVNAYKTFDFVDSYVPNDLEKRGFPVCHLDDKKYHNYAYARDIAKSWFVLRKFVCNVLQGHYKNGDVDVRDDKYITNFCAEMQSAEGGKLTSFPTINTLDSLIDVVTMCIHIAAPQHTAVNYLQQFYLSFIPNRPASLAAPIPRSLEELNAYTEAHVMASLPLADQKDWLIMAEIPYLLSSEVDPENNIIAYAEQAVHSTNPLIAKASEEFRQDLEELTGIFHKFSDEMDDQATKYHVLDPEVMANSILI
ncbi:lipoxygenase [Crepidotus variabilis]|uniref:Manganese lipoxygenase n=1 Tax=Crepidotus variabilis TaxID=179855 RepID=A0A9P6ESL7_9AGAR|nr:lipoxygenase [Crepidotus variabilis]